MCTHTHLHTDTRALRLRCCCYDYILSAVNVLSDTVKSKRILMFSYLLLFSFSLTFLLLSRLWVILVMALCDLETLKERPTIPIFLDVCVCCEQSTLHITSNNALNVLMNCEYIYEFYLSPWVFNLLDTLVNRNV